MGKMSAAPVHGGTATEAHRIAPLTRGAAIAFVRRDEGRLPEIVSDEDDTGPPAAAWRSNHRPVA
jgi:hypothetical protein